MTFRVSYFVPAYNYGRFVTQAVDSLLMQQQVDIEVIVIDDASTDNTPEVLARYGNDPRVRLIRHLTNRGHIATYNEGLSLARGEFVGLMSADDFFLRSDAVMRYLELFDAHPRVGMVYSAHAFVEGDSITSYAIPWAEDYARDGLAEFESLMWEDHIPASGTLVRKQVQDELGPYDPRLPHSGDWDMWLRAAARYDVGYVAEPMVAYRMHDVNMCHSQVPPAQAIEEVRLMLEGAFASLPPTAPQHLVDKKRSVLEHGLLQTAWTDLFHGRRLRTWQGLVHALRREPRLALTRTAWGFGARAALMTVVGRSLFRSMLARD